MAKKPRVEIVLGEPSIIAQSDVVVKSTEQNFWGWYQFPNIVIQENGDYLCGHTMVHRDHPSSAGKGRGYAISKDQGKTWSRVEYDPETAREKFNGQFELPNGEKLRCANLPARHVSEFVLPPEPIYVDDTYGWDWKFYRAEDVDPELSAIHMERYKPDTNTWEPEELRIVTPGLTAVVIDGLCGGIYAPHQFFWGPDGKLWFSMYVYCQEADGRCLSRAVYAYSADMGHTFEYVSGISYQPIPEVDEFWDKRTGYFEPGTTFLPDGSMVTLLRTMDFCVGPMHISHSTDEGRTWSKPAFFDDVSVAPVLLTLKNGVTLALYGRPGQYVRATADPAAKDWDDRVAIVPPNGQIMTDTCSNAQMVAIDDNAVYVVYSDFQCPNPQGIPVKSILGRTITTRILR